MVCNYCKKFIIFFILAATALCFQNCGEQILPENSAGKSLSVKNGIVDMCYSNLPIHNSSSPRFSIQLESDSSNLYSITVVQHTSSINFENTPELTFYEYNSLKEMVLTEVNCQNMSQSCFKAFTASSQSLPELMDLTTTIGIRGQFNGGVLSSGVAVICGDR